MNRGIHCRRSSGNFRLSWQVSLLGGEWRAGEAVSLSRSAPRRIWEFRDPGQCSLAAEEKQKKESLRLYLDGGSVGTIPET